jgi:SAM-dependent methyltransferase
MTGVDNRALTSDDWDLSRYAAMLWNTPLSTTHADLLLDRLGVTSGNEVLDFGCGWGELLLRAIGSTNDVSVRGVGVDTDAAALVRGRALAAARGLADRVRFDLGEADAYEHSADRLISIGAAHAWGGTAPALEALAGRTRPDARLLFGEGCWEREPSRAAAEIFGEDVLPVPGLLSAAHATGWRVLHLSTADQREWDEFESTWRAGRQEWLLAHPRAPETAARQADLDARLEEYLSAYRGELGFCYLILAR